MQFIGVDPGRFKTKVWYDKGYFEFYSSLGEYRDFEFDDEKGEDDLKVEYKGSMYSGGTLSIRESEYGGSMMTDSKLHEDTLILVLIGLHKAFKSCDVGLVTGLPVIDHNQDKKELSTMLSGYHEITVNNVTKWFRIQAAVAPEGSCFYKFADRGLIRGLQIGSRTVNAITFYEGQKIGKESDTFDFGMESGKNRDSNAMARAIISKTGSLKWKKDDLLFLCGGGSSRLFPHIKKYYTNGKMVMNPVFSDAEAFYRIAREVYG